MSFTNRIIGFLLVAALSVLAVRRQAALAPMMPARSRSAPKMP